MCFGRCRYVNVKVHVHLALDSFSITDLPIFFIFMAKILTAMGECKLTLHLQYSNRPCWHFCVLQVVRNFLVQVHLALGWIAAANLLFCPQFFAEKRAVGCECKFTLHWARFLFPDLTFGSFNFIIRLKYQQGRVSASSTTTTIFASSVLNFFVFCRWYVIFWFKFTLHFPLFSY